MRDTKSLIENMAKDIQYDLNKAGKPVSDEVALAAANAHVEGGGKDEAMEILNKAGVGMFKKKTSGGEGLGGKTECFTYFVGKVSVFIGYETK